MVKAKARNETLYEFIATLSFYPPDETEHRARMRLEFLAAVEKLVFFQANNLRWNSYFSFALLEYLTTHSELLMLLNRYPDETSLEDLIAKLNGLTERFLMGEGLIHMIQASTSGGSLLNDLDETSAHDIIGAQPWAMCGELGGGHFNEEVFCFGLAQEIRDYLRPALTEFFLQDTERPVEEVKAEAVRLLREGGYLDRIAEMGKLFSATGTFAGEDVSNFVALQSWKPELEQERIKALRVALNTVPECLTLSTRSLPFTGAKIPDKVAPVPFRQAFADFLHVMEQRQVELESIYNSYYGRGDVAPFFEWWNGLVEPVLNDAFTYSALFAGNTASALGIDVGAILASEDAQHAIAQVLGVFIELGTFGKELQYALTEDPVNTIAGMILGMAGAGTGAFLFLDVYFYLSDPSNGWGNWRNELGGGAFQTGTQAGEFGMGVSELAVTGFKFATPGATPRVGDITISFGGGIHPSGGAGSALALQFSASYPVVVSGAVVEDLISYRVAGLGSYAAMSADSTGDDEPPEEPDAEDPWEEKLFEGYTEEQKMEIKRLMEKWDKGSYTSMGHSIVDHADRKGYDYLSFLSQADQFNKRGATRIPKFGTREDGSVMWRKRDGQFLIERNGKIVTYGRN